jgi:hypothetical protein
LALLLSLPLQTPSSFFTRLSALRLPDTSRRIRDEGDVEMSEADLSLKPDLLLWPETAGPEELRYSKTA